MCLLQIDSNGELSLTKDWKDWTTDFPRYAILSHTWGPDDHEVTFTDLKDGSGKGKAGYAKIKFSGEQARKDDIQYFWVDTCCIDKSSSAELTEAINSMFRWYQNAAKCYVYLSDVSRTGHSDGDQDTSDPTLEFFSWEGNNLGSKRSLEHDIHHVTGISLEALRGVPLAGIAVEERLSWANRRETSRPEDKAYSLLGLFKVFVPLLYGEGRENAFVRLREEIAKSSDRVPQYATYSHSTKPSEASSSVTCKSPQAAGTSYELNHNPNDDECHLDPSSSGESSPAHTLVPFSKAPKHCSCSQTGLKRRSGDISSSAVVRVTKRARYEAVDLGNAGRPQTVEQSSLFSQFMTPEAIEKLCRYVWKVWGDHSTTYNADSSQLEMAESRPMATSIPAQHLRCALLLIIGVKAAYQHPYIQKFIRVFFGQPVQGSASYTLLLFAAALAGQLLTQLSVQIGLLTDNSLSFEDAFGDKIRVPCFVCQHYEIFHGYLEARFKNRPGVELVVEKSYCLIIGGIEGQVLDTTKWSQIVKTHPQIMLTMAMVLNRGYDYEKCTKCHKDLTTRSYRMFTCDTCSESYPTVEAFSDAEIFDHRSTHDVSPQGQHCDSSEPVLRASILGCAPFLPHYDYTVNHALEDEPKDFAHTMLTVEGLTLFHRMMKAAIQNLVRRYHLRSEEFYINWCSNRNMDIPEDLLFCLYGITQSEKFSVYIDYILNHVGQQYFFDYLLASLRPRTINHPYGVGKVVAASIVSLWCVQYVLGSMARSTSEYPDLIANHTDLIRKAMNLACRRNGRLTQEYCCSMVRNLVGLEQDEPHDQTARNRRIDQLEKIGAFDTMRVLCERPGGHVRSWARDIRHDAGQQDEADFLNKPVALEMFRTIRHGDGQIGEAKYLHVPYSRIWFRQRN